MSDKNYATKPDWSVSPLFAANLPTQPPAPTNARFATVDPPRSTQHQETRWATQDEAYAQRLGDQPARILAHIRATPSTCDEVEIALELTHQSASAAINGLMNSGAVIATTKRKTRSGRNARVWEAT